MGSTLKLRSTIVIHRKWWQEWGKQATGTDIVAGKGESINLLGYKTMIIS